MPKLFAVRPISNRRETRPDPLRQLPAVPIWEYVPGSGAPIDFDSEPSLERAFNEVDLDVWGREFVVAVDSLLGPELREPTAVLGASDGVDHIARLLDTRERLTEAMSKLVVPVLRDETATDAEHQAARDAFRQALRHALDNLYATRAVIQLPTSPPPHSPPTQAAPTPIPGADSDLWLTTAAIDLVDRQWLVTMLLTGEHDPDRATLRTFVEIDADAVRRALGRRQADDASVAASVGRILVPIPMRQYPQPPAIRHGVHAPVPNADVDEDPSESTAMLQDHLRWAYEVTSTESSHHAHDRTYFDVRFGDSLEPAMPVESGCTGDLFAALAQFSAVWPQIRADLTDQLQPIEGHSDPNDASALTQHAIARAALQSFHEVAERVADAWLREDPELTPPTRPSGDTGDENSYRFSIAEHEHLPAHPCSRPSGIGNLPDGALCVQLTGAPPAAVAISAPTVEIADWATEASGTDTGFAFTYWRDESAPADSVGQPTTGALTVLPAASGAAIPARQVILPDLPIFTTQLVQVSAYRTRNEQLLPGDRPATADPFVYATPAVEPALPLRPTIDISRIIDIGRIGAEEHAGMDPRARPLDEHLGALFTELFRDAPEIQHTVKLAIDYEFQVVGGSPLTTMVPVMLVPPTEFVADDAPCAQSSTSLVCRITDGFWAWFAASSPSVDHAAIHLDVSVFSESTTTPVPLVGLHRLRLGLEDVIAPS